MTTVDIVMNGAPRRATLRMPTIGQAQTLMADASLHRSTESIASARRIEMFDVIATVDDGPISWSLAAAVADEPAAVAAVRAAASAQVDAEVRRGSPNVEASYGSWPRTDPERGLLAPALARLPDPLLRLARPTSARPVDFVLPSGGIGRLDWLDPFVEAAAWTRWAPVGLDPVGDRDEWTFESAGFRAVLRLCCALVRLGERTGDDLTPGDVEALSLGDFTFLDELYRRQYVAEDGGATRG